MTLGLILAALSLAASADSTIDVLSYRDGGEIRGKVLKIVQGEGALFRTEAGELIQVPEADIASIAASVPLEIPPPEPAPAARPEKPVYILIGASPFGLGFPGLSRAVYDRDDPFAPMLPYSPAAFLGASFGILPFLDIRPGLALSTYDGLAVGLQAKLHFHLPGSRWKGFFLLLGAGISQLALENGVWGYLLSADFEAAAGYRLRLWDGASLGASASLTLPGSFRAELASLELYL